MKKILKVDNPNDYARFVDAPVLHPLLSIIHYDELAPFRHSLNNYGVYVHIIISEYQLEARGIEYHPERRHKNAERHFDNIDLPFENSVHYAAYYRDGSRDAGKQDREKIVHTVLGNIAFFDAERVSVIHIKEDRVIRPARIRSFDQKLLARIRRCERDKQPSRLTDAAYARLFVIIVE